MTALWTDAALARATGGRLAARVQASGVSIDTRTLAPGDLFVALVGENGDGHAHVAAAFERGAAASVVHAAGLTPDLRLLHVTDTQQALADLGHFARARFAGRLVAVTGSVGKTTTKEMLRIALSALGPTHAAEASHNNHWGVPLTLARLPGDASFCVCEIGMNHPGEIAPLAAIARPDVAVITTIAASHIGHMGSLAAIAEEKGALLESLRPGGVAVIPAGAHGAERMAMRAREAGARVIRFGGEEDAAEARIAGLVLHADETRFTAILDGERIEVRLAAPGRHMAMNALACLAAVRGIGGDVRRAAKALLGFTPGDGRGALRPLLGGTAWLLDESYNASAASVRASLDVLRLLRARRRVAVLGDMLELGDFAVDEHESLAPFVRDSADIVYCCGDMMTKLYRLLPPHLHGGCETNAAALAPLVRRALRPGDVVLVKGSHGSRMREIVAAITAASSMVASSTDGPG